MKKVMEKFKFLYYAIPAILTTALLTSPAFAEDSATVTAVTGAFGALKTDIMSVLSAVALLGVGVMGVFLAWKYGRKIFNSVGH